MSQHYKPEEEQLVAVETPKVDVGKVEVDTKVPDKVENTPTVDLKSIFGIDDVEVLKRQFDLGAKYKEDESVRNALKEDLEGYKAFVDKAINPASFFSSEEGMYVESAKMKYPRLDYAAASKLIKQDAKDMKPLEALVLNEMLQNAEVDLSVDEAEMLVLETLGMTKEDVVDAEPGSYEDKKMQTKAKIARQQIASVQAELKQKPEAQTLVDFMEKHKAQSVETEETIKKAWAGKMAETVGSIKNLTIKDEAGEVYAFEVPESYIKEMEDVMMANVVSRRLQPTEEGVEEVQKNLHAYFWRDNAPKLLRAFEKDIRSKILVEIDEKFGTAKPSNLDKDVAISQNDGDSYQSMKPKFKSFDL